MSNRADPIFVHQPPAKWPDTPAANKLRAKYLDKYNQTVEWHAPCEKIIAQARAAGTIGFDSTPIKLEYTWCQDQFLRQFRSLSGLVHFNVIASFLPNTGTTSNITGLTSFARQVRQDCQAQFEAQLAASKPVQFEVATQTEGEVASEYNPDWPESSIPSPENSPTVSDCSNSDRSVRYTPTPSTSESGSPPRKRPHYAKLSPL